MKNKYSENFWVLTIINYTKKKALFDLHWIMRAKEGVANKSLVTEKGKSSKAKYPFKRSNSFWDMGVYTDELRVSKRDLKVVPLADQINFHSNLYILFLRHITYNIIF